MSETLALSQSMATLVCECGEQLSREENRAILRDMAYLLEHKERAPDQAQRVTMFLVSNMMKHLSGCADAACDGNAELARAHLDLFNTIRDQAYAWIPVMKESFQGHQETIENSLRVSLHAECLFLVDIRLRKKDRVGGSDNNPEGSPTVNSRHEKTYIIKSPASGLLKIGKTIDMKQRLAALQNGSGVPLEVLVVIDENIEHELHLRFKNLRVFGEWFRDDGQIAQFIEEGKKSWERAYKRFRIKPGYAKKATGD
jgi:hypothetical protein